MGFPVWNDTLIESVASSVSERVVRALSIGGDVQVATDESANGPRVRVRVIDADDLQKGHTLVEIALKGNVPPITIQVWCELTGQLKAPVHNLPTRPHSAMENGLQPDQIADTAATFQRASQVEMPPRAIPYLMTAVAATFAQGPHEVVWSGIPDPERPPLWFTAENAHYRITAALSGGVSHALAHNRLPVVRKLWIENLKNSPQELLTLDVAAEWALGDPPLRTAHLELASPEPDHPRLLKVSMPEASEQLATLDEAVPGQLTFHLRGERSGDFRAQQDIDVLAHNEWSLRLMPESLATFVQPNHPAIVQVLHDASQRLEERTGSGSLEGYQSGSGARVGEIAWALYEALRARSITYINPPASFETAQKIRTPSQVIDGRLGTCLDLAVTYAACLEQVGLHPVLFLYDGHANVGFFVEERHTTDTILTDFNTVMTLVESGAVIAIETVTITASEGSSFEEAIEGARLDLSTGRNVLRSMINVHAARAVVRPLPTPEAERDADPSQGQGGGERHSRGSAGGAPTRHGGPAERRLQKIGTYAPAGHAPEDNSPPRVRRWKTTLLDLSLRNRLLNFREGATSLALLLPAQALHDFEDMVATGHSFQLIAADKLTNLHVEQGIRAAQELPKDELEAFLFDQRRVFTAVNTHEYPTRLRGLKAKARALEEETGANHLFLTLGELVWTEDGAPEAEAKRLLRSPLLLVPARLDGGVRGKPGYKFHIEEGGYAVPNYSLLEKLRVVFGLEIPELMKPPSDDAGVDVDAVLAATRAAIAKEQLPFRVDDSAHLALLSFTTFRLWKDLDEFHETILRSPVVSHLVHSATEPFADPAGSGHLQFRETDLICPKGADGSQMEAVAWAAAGRSFVLEGPPGTGKSQTITNMIAQLVHDGKTVLFVAEKQPALEVVERRLAEVGLGDLCLNMHGKKQSPKEIRADIKRSINLSAQASDAMWRATQAHIAATMRELAGYPGALHTPNAVGKSVWSAWESTLVLGEGPVAPISRKFITAHGDRLDEIQLLLGELPDTCRAVGVVVEHPWREVRLRRAEELKLPQVKADIAALAAAVARLEVIGADVRPVWEPAQDPQGLEVAAWLLKLAADGLAPTSAQLQAATAPDWRASVEHAASLVGQYASKPVATRQRYRPEVANLDLASLHAQASEAMQKMMGRRKLNAIAAQLQGFLTPGQMLTREQVVADLSQLLADQQEGWRLNEWVRSIPGLTLPPGWHALGEGSVEHLRSTLWAIAATQDLVRSNPEVRDLLDRLAASRPNPEVARAVASVAAAWKALAASAAMPAAGPGSHGGSAGHDGHEGHSASPLIARIKQYLPQWHLDADRDLLALRRWVAMETLFARLRGWGLAELCDQVASGGIALDDVPLAFERGLAAESLRERFEAGGLDRFDAGVHDRAAEQYVSRLESLREQMTAWVPTGYLHKAAASRNTPAFGQLKREADKARSRTSIRTLMEKYGTQVQSVAPCFLMSPDSVARLVNPTSLSFDVVILDEASQIKVAEAVGALGRGKSVIVVGDSRQMPPTSIAEVGLADDEELIETDVLPLDEESILTEAVQAGLPQLWLSWHYRSEDESLIAFSNHRYYDGRLASFPSPQVGNPGTGVHLRRVDGVFDRGRARVNRIEAEAVVAEVVNRRNNPETAHQTLGVVTFNQQQQKLIDDLLHATGDDAVLAAMEEESDPARRLFVKNLETVQGDERDVILFSLSFSRDPATGRLPLNFGPLNRSGGERRLNVAVTRAKQMVILFASFEPEDIKTEQTSSVGLKDLREYLIMARANSVGMQEAQAHAIEGRDLHREQIAAALVDRGLRVQTAYGLSDFTVDIAVGREGEASWRVAVLLDGPRWAQRPTVADRDGFPLAVLGDKMKWPHVVRVWLPSWLAERESILDGIVERVMEGPSEAELAIAAAEAETTAEEVSAAEVVASAAGATSEGANQAGPTEVAVVGVPRSGTSGAEIQADDAAPDLDQQLETELEEALRGAEALAGVSEGSDSPSPEAREPALRRGSMVPTAVHSSVDVQTGATESIRRVPFESEDSQTVGTIEVLDAIDQDWARQIVEEITLAVVEQSGPIELGRLARVVGRRFGMHRMRANRASAVTLCVPIVQVDRSPLGAFAWPAKTDATSWRVMRYQKSAAERPMPEVPPEEILNAVRWSISTEGISSGEPLIRAVLGQFGQTRLTAQAQQRINDVLDLALEHGWLRREGSRFVVVEQPYEPKDASPRLIETWSDRKPDRLTRSALNGRSADIPRPAGDSGHVQPHVNPAAQPPPQFNAAAWQDVIKYAAVDVHGLSLQLAATGIDAPEVGFEVNDGTWCVELAWPARSVAVLTDVNEARDAWLRSAGWTIALGDSPNAMTEVVEALAGN